MTTASSLSTSCRSISSSYFCHLSSLIYARHLSTLSLFGYSSNGAHSLHCLPNSRPDFAASRLREHRLEYYITINWSTMATQLIALPAVERLSPTVIRILGGNPGKFTLQGTNTYLLGTGRRRLLIDTGEGRNAWISSIRETLQQENATIDTALITHWHHDHTGGIRDLLSISPQTRIFKHTPEEGQHGIMHGQRFQVDGATLTAAYTPGHTKDHMVFVLEEEDAMFTADNVLGQGTAVFEDMITYLRSLEEMRPLFKGRAYPGHGPVIENGPAKIAEYIAHRKQREDQVIQTLKTGPGEVETQESALWSAWTATDLVEVIYKDVPQNLHPAARGGVLQILGKLESEDRVARDGDEWKLLVDGRASL